MLAIYLFATLVNNLVDRKKFFANSIMCSNELSFPLLFTQTTLRPNKHLKSKHFLLKNCQPKRKNLQNYTLNAPYT